MQKLKTFFFVVVITLFAACDSGKTKPIPFFTAKDVVLFNQLVYKENVRDSFNKYAPSVEIVFLPDAVNGNYAIIAKNRSLEQYALIVRGTMIEFTHAGFQNFLQDFTVFTIKLWNYADTVKEAYISEGTYNGLQNLLQLRDGSTGLSLKEFIEKKIPALASIVITGHSLGGNLAYPLAGYLKKELPADQKNNLQLITFGATAAGNAAFVQDMEEKFPGAERYVTDKDIAPLFPDMDRVNELAKKIGLDSVLQINKYLNAGDLFSIAGEILERTDVINKTNKYVQSRKHLRILTGKDPVSSGTNLSVDAIFEKAYHYHRIDMYAELLGGKVID